ncbi:unnamed protein product [Acanthoscelides obtectus]|uniref:Uncharacterized protein n=1 Tax=Acanthoscelides obtectus TaxID=200917 RepID=A0A9P0KFN6_ACAOB|nr:unnamed protein product [Acanthoscelides obtectus]CAK1633459.1 hypothetical protein AOBTE_LOCUS8152 [Acanthoscelides obtectus]
MFSQLNILGYDNRRQRKCGVIAKHGSIAKVFLRRFGSVHELRQSNPEVGEVLQITEKGTNRKIFYLVTKKASYPKPKY